jgi:phosphatidylinositol 4-kinase
VLGVTVNTASALLLQARTVAEPIIATVSLMAESGLPCFSRGAPVANLRNRFHLEMNDAQVCACSVDSTGL